MKCGEKASNFSFVKISYIFHDKITFNDTAVLVTFARRIISWLEFCIAINLNGSFGFSMEMKFSFNISSLIAKSYLVKTMTVKRFPAMPIVTTTGTIIRWMIYLVRCNVSMLQSSSSVLTKFCFISSSTWV